MRLVTGFLVLLALWWLPVSAQTPGTPADTSTPDELHVFVREGCPHCASAKEFLAALGPEDLRGVRVVLRDVSQDEQARSDLERLSKAVGAWPPGVPTFLFKGTVLVGFDDSEHTGRALLELIQQDGARPAVRDQVETQLFGPLNVNRLGMPLFTLALGLLDGFNPCATWVLLFLLSLLVRLRDRRRMAVVAGTFVLASGAVYYAFMAAWLNFFVVLGLSSTLRVVLGTVALLIGLLNVKDFFAFGRGPSFSIPDSAKPGLYERMRRVMAAPTLGLSLVSVITLAVLVNFVELLCTAGFPAIYTAVLTQHEPTAAGRYAYLGLYIVGYMADDALMVGLAVSALSRRKLSERAGRVLKLLAGSVMLLLGLVLLLRPGWLM
ncbi:MAG: glutaredoxin family protein [Gammaproteobacteria bacterium]|uniref:glutaredoxin family protein n=1 Tax=Hydrogenophaga sp. TaxID=1904254 RepID=UPI000CBD3F17|nr:glutaredoxin family protein [Hydrogenophaga sp.]MBU4180496.1 glutaredoxin family protein [Gammaproteobacteria bacterium]PKO79082.1 MAG: NrdH-redoxin [Betaproteobacteria bacterium HGW-Betaproteobacteria-15]MBU4279571.1 glutaredoxin family protein [Gammaproteobacteria bacterium]MBU4323110.1 glutaredoxin family protein [Gammaproteobacteria bacterium]MBU4508969.1 glutaredoxin family protein [Gammaproteobacteria bacterium]